MWWPLVKKNEILFYYNYYNYYNYFNIIKIIHVPNIFFIFFLFPFLYIYTHYICFIYIYNHLLLHENIILYQTLIHLILYHPSTNIIINQKTVDLLFLHVLNTKPVERWKSPRLFFN